MNEYQLFNPEAFQNLAKKVRRVAQEKITFQFGLHADYNTIQVYGSELAMRRVAAEFGMKAFELADTWGVHLKLSSLNNYGMYLVID